jgi:heme-degrading monooxygenase HmoA
MLAISRFRVVNGLEQAVTVAFQDRPHLVEQAPGFLGMNVFTDHGDPGTFLLITRWKDLESYRAWHSSEAHTLSHKGIPAGLKLDPAQTQLSFWDDIPPKSDGSPHETSVQRWTPFLSEFLPSSSVVHFLAARIDGSIQACNAQMTSLLGFSEHLLLGKHVWSYLTTADARRLKTHIAKRREAEREAGVAGRQESSKPLLLNFVAADQEPHSLECELYYQDDCFAVFGTVPFQQKLELAKELREVNHEMAVLVRENARQNKELKSAKITLRKTLHELNTVYWQLRGIEDILPICVKCGKVASGKAQGEALLGLLQDRFPFLSHGYCPECAWEVLAGGEEPDVPA